MIYIVGVIIALFLAFLLLLKKKQKADWILMFWLIVLAFHTSLVYLDMSGEIVNYGFLIGVSIPLPLLHGPFLFIYTSLLLHPQHQITKYGIHLCPYLVMNLPLIEFYGLSKEEKLFIFNHDGVGYESYVFLNILLVGASGIGYVSWSYLIIRRYQKKLRQGFSKIDGVDLNWLRFLSVGIGIIWLFVFVGNVALIFSGVALFIIMIGILGIRQTGIFSTQPHYFKDLSPSASSTSKYEKSGLNEERKISLEQALKHCMESDNPHLNPDLSLSELAEMIGTQPNYLSQVLNERFKTNFYDFINARRVDDFCEKLAAPENSRFKLIEIAYQCGFNSKSSFNRNFKLHTGKTPSAYLKASHPVGSNQ